MARFKKQTKRRRNECDNESSGTPPKRRKINPQSRRSHPPNPEYLKVFKDQLRKLKDVQSRREQAIEELRISQQEEMKKLRGSYNHAIDEVKKHIHAEIERMERRSKVVPCRVCNQQRVRHASYRCWSCFIAVCTDCTNRCDSCQETYCDECAKDALTTMDCGLQVCTSVCEHYHTNTCVCTQSEW